ncbi:MAG: NAD(P)H-dependent oxidoreductase [Heliobacteriaceae bacterium]|jgi:modulator of drug activity B|nr:NAD(P)H-dependent oxidoreductase [Heliobacteriaceae bacterium]
MKIFVINGHKYYPFAQGKLNQTLFEEIINTLTPDNEVKSTIVEHGYNIQEEIEKFLWADTIIFQTPINWFAFPGILKKYIDEIYQYNIFYGSSEEYGQGGLLKGKKYMYSLTWSSPGEAFEKVSGFYEGHSVDEVILAMHKTQQFCGLEKLPTFSAHAVLRNPDVPLIKEQLREHLEKYMR